MPLEKVATTSELQPGELKLVQVQGEDICLANVNGEYLAIGNVCTHAEGPLHEGQADGDEVECPWHGSQFSLRTGEATMSPATEPVKVYAVRVEGNDILVGSE